MAPPAKSLRRQERHPFLPGNCNQFLHLFPKGGGERVFGVVPKSEF
jgi:hypothetical protein